LLEMYLTFKRWQAPLSFESSHSTSTSCLPMFRGICNVESKINCQSRVNSRGINTQTKMEERGAQLDKGAPSVVAVG
jgi:hypothetical protein